MVRTRLRWASSMLAALVAFPPPSLAFDTPLSDTAVREAYFLGQRHDESVGKFLDKYAKHLAAPKSGPYISSVAMFTPYARVVLETSQRVGNYSAQQAQIDHRDRKETILCIVEIQLTETYPALIADPARSTASSPANFVPRPYDFWTEFQVRFLDGDDELRPFTSWGRPNYSCSENGGCLLTGATIQFEFYASSFPTTAATVQIDPPDGDPLALNFDLASVR